MIRAFFILFLLLSTARYAYGQTADPNDLKALTDKQKKAEFQANKLSKQRKEVQGQIDNLRRDLINVTAKARGFENAGNQAKAHLAELQMQEKGLSKLILADHDSLAQMLVALQRIERNPPPALLVSAHNASDTARAANLITYLTGELKMRSKTLRTRLIQLQIVRSEIATTNEKITENTRAINMKLTGMKSIMTTKSKLSNQIDKDRKKRIAEAEKFAKEAKTLQDLILRFERNASDIMPRIKPPKGARPIPRVKPKTRKAPSPVYIPKSGGRFADMRGHLPLPVFGKLSRKYNSKLAGGGRAQGINLSSKARAQVVAPFSGRVEFAGAFNDDHVVILNVGGGYFIVLTGLGKTFPKAGTEIDAGEPLGLMPSNPKKRHDLYMEFRKNRVSIDPSPWIKAALAKE
ncbi:MAG: peptidoglycan DD-metalloendopeptidase family protein [Robiginitomaculum sp.]